MTLPRTGSAPESGPRRLVLVGFMGCGKTTVGQTLARLMEWSFQDMDRWIEDRAGQSVRKIFDTHGEDYFRAEELRVAELAQGLDRVVVAAGGGAFVAPETRRALQSGALTVWLKCDWDTVVSRVGLGGIRPKATNRGRMRELFTEREPVYRQADTTVDVTSLTIDGAARQIAKLALSARGGQAAAGE